MSPIIDRALCLNDSPISHVSRNLVMAKHSCGDNLLLSPFLWHNQNYRVKFQSQVSHSSHPAGSKLHNAGARKVVWVPGLKFVSICAGYLQWNYVKEHQQQRRRSAAEGKSYTISSLSEHCALTKDACNSKSQVNNVNIKLTAECLPSSATSIHSLLNTIRITLHAGSLYLLIWLSCMCRVWSCVLSIPSDAPAEICMRRRRRRASEFVSSPASRALDNGPKLPNKNDTRALFYDATVFTLSPAFDGTLLAGTFLLQPRRPFCQENKL